MTFSATIKRPSAYVPLVMSTLALGVLVMSIALHGLAPQVRAGRQDEGTAAHLWQLLMAGQVPVIMFFAIKWLGKDFRAALPVLGLQVCAYGAALLPVFLLGY
jgi:hypothetical protein